MNIYGNNLDSDIGTIRQSMGLCNQQDVLFDNLTAKEHLEFVASIKGLSS